MISFYADEFCEALASLLEFRRRLDLIEGGDDLLPPQEMRDGAQIVRNFFSECDKAGLTRPLDRAERLRYLGEQGRDQSRYTVNVVRWELDELRSAAFTDLRERTFLSLEDSAQVYFKKTDLFGSIVGQRFPKATYDIQEAGNCYAAGCYTACVFHLMRVVEHGLRSVARKLKVPFGRTLELKEWGKLIDSIEKEVKQIIQRPKSLKRTKDLEFYNVAAAQLRYFKDGWRNHVMHTRANYDKHEASVVMVHVREFMQHLATRIKQ